uniref:Uncharacterized protein n=1 Tax=viral metagenome TaxID=1070528 RepID=A0A6C0C922_9ZZZZ
MLLRFQLINIFMIDVATLHQIFNDLLNMTCKHNPLHQIFNDLLSITCKSLETLRSTFNDLLNMIRKSPANATLRSNIAFKFQRSIEYDMQISSRHNSLRQHCVQLSMIC